MSQHSLFNLFCISKSKLVFLFLYKGLTRVGKSKYNREKIKRVFPEPFYPLARFYISLYYYAKGVFQNASSIFHHLFPSSEIHLPLKLETFCSLAKCLHFLTHCNPPHPLALIYEDSRNQMLLWTDLSISPSRRQRTANILPGDR